MKDQRFLPIEKHDPSQEAEDYSDDDDFSIGEEADSHREKKHSNTLYMAS
jgi:hypothetical protein